jgi:hypothetical protein
MVNLSSHLLSSPYLEQYTDVPTFFTSSITPTFRQRSLSKPLFNFLLPFNNSQTGFSCTPCLLHPLLTLGLHRLHIPIQQLWYLPFVFHCCPFHQLHLRPSSTHPSLCDSTPISHLGPTTPILPSPMYIIMMICLQSDGTPHGRMGLASATNRSGKVSEAIRPGS